MYTSRILGNIRHNCCLVRAGPETELSVCESLMCVSVTGVQVLETEPIKRGVCSLQQYKPVQTIPRWE